jgi:hypothetical protein
MKKKEAVSLSLEELEKRLKTIEAVKDIKRFKSRYTQIMDDF